MPQYCFYVEQCKYTSEEEEQQGDTVAVNMGSAPFSACVFMAHCRCPKTSPLCSVPWVMLHRLLITESPFTPLYFSPAIFTSLPTSPSVNLLGLHSLVPPSSQCPWWGPCLQGTTTPFLGWWLWKTGPGYSFWTWWWGFFTSNQSLITFPLPGSFSDGCTSTLHQQHPPGVDVATLSIIIWQILPKSKRNMSVVHISADTIQKTLPYPRKTYIYWQKSTV